MFTFFADLLLCGAAGKSTGSVTEIFPETGAESASDQAAARALPEAEARSKQAVHRRICAACRVLATGRSGMLIAVDGRVLRHCRHNELQKAFVVTNSLFCALLVCLLLFFFYHTHLLSPGRDFHNFTKLASNGEPQPPARFLSRSALHFTSGLEHGFRSQRRRTKRKSRMGGGGEDGEDWVRRGWVVVYSALGAVSLRSR